MKLELHAASRSLLLVLLAMAPAACGDGAVEDAGTGGTAAGGTAAGGTDGAGTGGTAAGGTGSGGDGTGTGGDGTGGGTSGDALCSPGDAISRADLAVSYTMNCPDWATENPDADPDSVARSIRLETPMTAGQPYALSFNYMIPGNGTLEYWAIDGECGAAIEKLSSEDMNGRSTICTDTTPTGNHEYVAMIWISASATSTDAAFCPNVSCK